MKSVLWRVAKRLFYIEDAWCLKVKGRGEVRPMWTCDLQNDKMNTVHLTYYQYLPVRLECLCVDARITLNYFLNKEDGKLLTEFVWLKMKISSGAL